MTTYKNVTITDRAKSTTISVPTSPVLENDTTSPTEGMVVKSDGQNGLLANEILREANCIYDSSDRSKYATLSSSNSTTTYTIYDFTTKTILTYKNGSQTSSVSVPATDKTFVPGMFLYDKNTKRLFFVKDTNMIIPIVL